MCVQTRCSLYEQREMFLRENLLFSLLICETYNILTSQKNTGFSTSTIYNHLSPFLKARTTYVYQNNTHAKQLFSSCEEMVNFVVSMLSDKIDKIYIKEDLYYCG